MLQYYTLYYNKVSQRRKHIDKKIVRKRKYIYSAVCIFIERKSRDRQARLRQVQGQ